jgi:hypothetical protein
MQSNDTSPNNFPITGWQILGKFKLLIGSGTEDMVNTWLTDILSPLDLPKDFQNKVLESAQNITTRMMQTGTGTDFEHIHLIVFVPPDLISKGRSWGFFRIEKIEGTTTDGSPPDHAVEFYLYLEE